jgi:hypothetical protein
MGKTTIGGRGIRPRRAWVVLLASSVMIAGLLSCEGGQNGNGSGALPQAATGTVTTTISDPPVCKRSGKDGAGGFEHVWITVTLVRAHLSKTAGDKDKGWVTLVDLRGNPMQIDLLSGEETECLLTRLGSTKGLVPGVYQQIRLHLLSNRPKQGEAVPSPNECAAADRPGFNCAQLTNGEIKLLALSSHDTTGIKIPAGQIVGGHLRLEAGRSADLNIDFNACRSIVAHGRGKLRLKPTLTAGQVSVQESISGRIVIHGAGTPLPAPARVFVSAVQRDEATGGRRAILEKMADPQDGTFILCPLPQGTYDLVATALDAHGVTYNATILFDVPLGTNVGDVPLVPEGGQGGAPATITGSVTSQDSSGGVEIDVEVAALQTARSEGGDPIEVPIPLLDGSSGLVSTATDDPSCPAGTACARYTLVVPASNPLVGIFEASGTTYRDPAPGEVSYRVEARAFNGAEPNCVEPVLSTGEDSEGNALVITAGGSVAAQTLAFTGCTEVTGE